jgi:nucleotide-binding universal stress UspA family protein
MNTRIMVPLDGSAFAEQALSTAVDLTCWTGQRLHAVRVHVPPQTSEGAGKGSESEGRSARAEEERYLREIADRCSATAGLAIRTALLDGAIPTTLATYINEHDIGLVVMTSHGRGGISRMWLGSVADALVRRVRIPVLLLRPCPSCGESKALNHLRHVLVPVDGSELSARILEPAARFGAAWDARITLLHVLTPASGRHADSASVDEARSDAEMILDELAAPLRRRGHRVDIAAITGDAPANAILDYAAAHDVGAIAMATRGRGSLRRLAVGSVADKIMRAFVLPLLLYRPPGIIGMALRETTSKSAEGRALLRTG